MGTTRLFPASVLLAALLGATTGAALAGPELCPTLEAQLAVVEQQADFPWDDGTDEIGRAIDRQRADLDAALARYRRAGCTGGGFLNKRQPGKCASINANTKRMRANLSRLNAQRRQVAADPYAGEQQRSALLRQLAANGCGAGYDAYADGAGRRTRGFFNTVFGNRGHINDAWRNGDYAGGSAILTPGPDFSYGTFRTLCVRTCDGYYFPISFSTGPYQFDQDESACRAMCPGTDVALYVHRNPGEDTRAMMSLAGQPYSALPTAFRYRKEYDSACKCGSVVASAAPVEQNYSSIITIGEPPIPAPEAPPGVQAQDPYADFIPEPPRRPLDDDPETLANRTGDLGLGSGGKAEEQQAVAGVDRDGKPIRLVGPSYYYQGQ